MESNSTESEGLFANKKRAFLMTAFVALMIYGILVTNILLAVLFALLWGFAIGYRVGDGGLGALLDRVMTKREEKEREIKRVEPNEKV